jgi:FAD/FMN-containing dehydrogenase
VIDSTKIASLRAAFQGRLITAPEEQAPFLFDWRKRWKGRALAVVQPDTAQDVASILRWCNATHTPIVPQGGNTGLVGASTPDPSGTAIVLSLARLNRVRSVDAINNTLVAEAGCILAQVQQTAAAHSRLFPLSLAAEGSCTIGGNLSTNAGGVQVLRYGNARELCLGLEVVTAQGELWDGLRGLRKDNTGYDLKHLFIGAEGTLGVITAASLKLFAQPAAQMTSLAALRSPTHALGLLTLAQKHLGPALTAFELMSRNCIELVLRHIPAAQDPFSAQHPHYVLLEASDAEGQDHAQARFEAMMHEALEAGLIDDAVVASSLQQSAHLWALRENITEAQAKEGKNIKHDISVPISAIDRFVEQTNATLEQRFPGIRMVVFGHLGDGNLHYNVSPAPGVDPEQFMQQEPEVNAVVYEAVARFSGSISAEHGIGLLKRDTNAALKSPVELALMQTIKRALDPLGLMNPGRVLPTAESLR